MIIYLIKQTIWKVDLGMFDISYTAFTRGKAWIVHEFRSFKIGADNHNPRLNVYSVK